MSLLGKVLALLNVFGAVGLAYFAIVDYTKRSAWAESAQQHELVLRGLPVDDKEPDKQHQPRVRNIDPQFLATLFGDTGGPAVKTQVEEVNRLKAITDAAINDAAGQEKDARRAAERKAFALAKVLRPLVDSTVERDQVEAALFHFANNQRADALKARFRKAHQDAVQPPPPELQKIKPQPTFAEAFQLSLRVQGGQPSAALSNILVRLLPTTAAEARNVNFDQVYDKALEQLNSDMMAEYDALYNAALGTAPSSDPSKRSAAAIQTNAIARLLFGLALYQTEAAVTGQSPPPEDQEIMKGLVPGTAAFAAKLPDTSTFQRQVRRVMVVTGPRELTNAVMRRTAALEAMTADIQADTVKEQLQFVADHSALVRQLRVLAEVLQDEARRVRDLQGLEKTQSSLVKAQAGAVLDRQSELRESMQETKDLFEAVKQKSTELLRNRQAIQQRIRDTELGEEHVRYLEKLARDLESERK